MVKSDKPNQKICICPNAWIFVGEVAEEMPDGGFLLSKAYSIRRWGTTKGIGELKDGPIIGKTILDPIDSPVHVHPFASFGVSGFDFNW